MYRGPYVSICPEVQQKNKTNHHYQFMSKSRKRTVCVLRQLSEPEQQEETMGEMRDGDSAGSW